MDLAVRPRRPLPGRHGRAGGDRPDRPPARRRHDLGVRRRRLRPLPHARARRSSHDLFAGAVPGAGHGRCRTASRSSTGPTCRWSTSSRCPTRASASRSPPVELVPVDDPVAVDPGQGRRRARRRQRRRPRRRRRRRAARRPRARPLHRLARAATSWPTPPASADRDHRHRLQPRPGPPLAQLAGRRRVHRGRRSAPADVLRDGRGRRAPAGVRRRRRDRRRSPCRTGRSRPGPRPTASRSPTGPRTAR